MDCRSRSELHPKARCRIWLHQGHSVPTDRSPTVTHPGLLSFLLSHPCAFHSVRHADSARCSRAGEDCVTSTPVRSTGICLRERSQAHPESPVMRVYLALRTVELIDLLIIEPHHGMRERIENSLRPVVEIPSPQIRRIKSQRDSHRSLDRAARDLMLAPCYQDLSVHVFPESAHLVAEIRIFGHWSAAPCVIQRRRPKREVVTPLHLISPSW